MLPCSEHCLYETIHHSILSSMKLKFAVVIVYFCLVTTGAIVWKADKSDLECSEGYVSRRACDGDTVCVPKKLRHRSAEENTAGQRMKSCGFYGEGTCKCNWVFREACGPSDHVCVPTPSRRQGKAQNYIGQKATAYISSNISASPGKLRTNMLQPAQECPASKDCGVCARTLNTPLEAAASMCNILGHQFYAGSAAGTLLAARFIRTHAKLLNNTPAQNSAGNINGLGPVSVQCGSNTLTAEANCSSEPNVPWILADYLIDADKEEVKGDTVKHMHAKAQVDLLLCSDTKCTEVADIQHARILGNSSQVCDKQMVLGYSMLLGTVLAVPVGSASDVASATVVNTSGSSVKEVVYSTLEPPMWHVQGPEPWVDPMTLGVLARLFAASKKGEDNNTYVPQWPLTYGAYKAKVLYSEWGPGRFVTSYPLMQPFVNRINECNNEDNDFKLVAECTKTCTPAQAPRCVVVILPADNTWMAQHGWNESDANCMKQVRDTTPVYIFDSYFYQAHLLDKLSSSRRLTDACPLLSTDPEGGDPDRRLKYKRVNMRAPRNSTMALGRGVFVGSGKYGLTSRCPRELGDNVPSEKSCSSFTTQDGAGCLTGQSNCVVLEIGSAAILTRAVPFVWSDGDIPLPYTAGDNRFKFRSGLPLLALSAQTDAMAHQGRYPSRPPWCELPSYYGTPFIFPSDTGFKERLDDAMNMELVDIYDCVTTGTEGNFPCFQKSLVRNCDYWDQQGKGYAHADSDPINRVPNRPLLDLLRPRWFLLDASPTYTAPVCKRTTVNSTGVQTRVLGRLVDARELRKYIYQSAQSIVQDVQRLLQQQLAQELAGTDSVASRLGAWTSLALTVVAIVAMASGAADIKELLHCIIERVVWDQMAEPCCVLLTALVVGVGLVLPPFLTLLNYEGVVSTVQQGAESKVGWLQSGTMASGEFVVVAVVTMLFNARPVDLKLVRNMLRINCCLAVVAFVLIMGLKVAPTPWKASMQHGAKATAHAATSLFAKLAAALRAAAAAAVAAAATALSSRTLHQTPPTSP